LLDLARDWRGKAGVLLFDDGPFAMMLREAEVPVEVLPLPATARQASKAAGPLRLLAAGPALVRFLFQLIELVRSADLVYLNTPKALVLGGLACLLTRRSFVYHLHDLIDSHHFSRANRFFLRAIGRRASVIIANSQATADAFASTKESGPRIEVIPNGFEVDPYATPAAARAGRETRLHLGLAGRFTRWKGQDVLLEALAQLPGVHAILVGDALFTGEDRAYGEHLRRRAAEPDLKGRVTFTGFEQNVIPLYHACDMIVHCSRDAEPFGRVIVEGMLAGKPVIASNAGGAREIVKDGVTGLLVEPDNPSALASAIKRLLDSPETAGAMAQRGAESASARFRLAAILEKTREILEALPALKRGAESDEAVCVSS